MSFICWRIHRWKPILSNLTANIGRVQMREDGDDEEENEHAKEDDGIDCRGTGSGKNKEENSKNESRKSAK